MEKIIEKLDAIEAANLAKVAEVTTTVDAKIAETVASFDEKVAALEAKVTDIGCAVAGCSSHNGFPSFSPVLFLYKQSGNVAIVPAIRFLHLATDGTLIASSLPTGLNANGRK